MHALDLAHRRPLSAVLCLGAHSDDIEIGCAGTLSRLAHSRPDLRFRWVVFSADAARRREAELSFARVLGDGGHKALSVHDFKEGFFPYRAEEIKTAFERLKDEISPDLIFTHCRADRHQDHALISDVTWQTFRDHLILEYEVPKYDGDLGSPNVFVELEAETCRDKVDGIVRCFESQASKPWFSEDTFMALMRLRGVECRSASGYAEAFYARKAVLDLGP